VTPSVLAGVGREQQEGPSRSATRKSKTGKTPSTCQSALSCLESAVKTSLKIYDSTLELQINVTTGQGSTSIKFCRFVS
jgi:hypothetical protein